MNVGKCWHKNLYSFKIGTFGSLKGVFKNLRKPYIKKTYIYQKEVLKGGIVPLYYVVRPSRRHCTFFLS